MKSLKISKISRTGWLALVPLFACLAFTWRSTAAGSLAVAAEKPDYLSEISHSSTFYQRLMWVGSQPPAGTENGTLWKIIGKMKSEDTASVVAELAGFVATHPNSPWKPSLQANLGRYYRLHGLYTRALDSWGAAWDATRQETSGPGKQIADFTFAHWTRLLASLGRVDTLTQLFHATEGRNFDSGPLQQIINGTREGYAEMLRDPGKCFKCGTYALHNIGRELLGDSLDTREMDALPSPKSGFNMTLLNQLAKKSGIDVVPVE